VKVKKLGKSNELQMMKKGVHSAFSKLRDELDDHLDGINRNSDEVQSLYEYMLVLERKMDKLSERLDELSSSVSTTSVEPLSLHEQEVFLSLYLAELPISSGKIASMLGFTKKAVDEYIDSIMQKGVPLLKESQAGVLHYAMELGFKAKQTKHTVFIKNSSVPLV